MKKVFLFLVALMGVTGAWAESVTFNYNFSFTAAMDFYSGEDAEVNFYVKQHLEEQSNDYVKVTIRDWTVRITSRTPDKTFANRITYTGYVRAEYVVVTCLQPSKISDLSFTELHQDGSYNTNHFNPGETEHTHHNTAGYLQSVTVNYQKIIHTHNPAAEWSYDENQHWHACTETGSTCDADGKLDLANHTYGQDGAAYYTCSVCNYVNESRRSEYETRDYMSFTAVDAPMTVGMTKTGSPVDYDLQYSLDKLHWSTVNLSATDNNIVEIPDGQTCYFRHGTETAINGINTDGNYWTFTMTGDGTIEAGGNIMSLLDITIQKNNVAAFAFANLFKGCATLTKAPKLPATSTGTRCYKGMFEETGITEAPALPAARVVKGAYENMFKNCLNLETVPELPAIRVDWLGYSEMFNGCKKITEITMGNIETIENGNAFSHWLDGTAYETEGTLIVPDAMVGQVSLPSNWQYKQKRDYIAAVSNATEGTASVIQNIGEDYITQIKQATSNDAALSLRDEALSTINTLKKYNSQIVDGQFVQPTEPGMRLKVVTKDEKVYEFQTTNLESTEYYRAE